MKKVVERILNLLAFLLTVDRPVTAEEIRFTVAGYDQAEDEAFRRTFERDKDLLRSLGIPLELRYTDAWEVEQGYVVPADDYILPDPGLTDEERAALWLAAQAVRLGGQPQGPGAIFKLGGAPLAAAGEPLAADLGEDLDGLAAAFTAVSERRTLAFTYRGRARRIDPFGMVHRRGHWYLAGREHPGTDVKAYRIDRATELTPGTVRGAFTVPDGFSVATAVPAAVWQAGSDEVTAQVLFDPGVAWWARRQLPPGTTVTERPDGSLEVELAVANAEALIGWILAFEDGAELLAPPDLRERLLSRVQGVA